MTTATAPRSPEQRKRDTLALLEAPHPNTWVATASLDSTPYLVPLTFAWDGRSILLATGGETRTVTNLQATGRARLAFGDTHDVVLMDAILERVIAATDPAAAPEVAIYAAQGGWDPSRSRTPRCIVALRPTRIQAWRQEHEFPGRVLMTEGDWLV
jgi:hypothetical protein